MQKKKNKLVCFPSLYSLSLYLSLYHFENPNEQTKKNHHRIQQYQYHKQKPSNQNEQ